MTIYSYVIEHDLGFAPNPFHGVCTLACCKPKIRKHAKKGDYILGTGSVKPGLQGHLCYWMRVDEILTFDQYWSDKRFHRKKPRMKASRYLTFGDNIYHHGSDGKTFVQEDSYHSVSDHQISESNLKRDTGSTDRVLVSREFAYWGRNGKPIPPEFADFVHKGPSHRNRFTEARQAEFLKWLSSQADRGLCGEPAHWRLLDRKLARGNPRSTGKALRQRSDSHAGS
jgi:hypothetical protein